MIKRCVATGCSNTYKDGVSLFQFPRDPALRKQWTKEVQRTRANWQGPSDNSILCSKHFTNDCFEEDTAIAARFGIEKRRRLKSNAVPTVFQRCLPHSSTETEAQDDPSTSRKRSISADCSPVQQKRAAFEKREKIRVTQYSSHIASYIASLLNILLADCTRSTGVKYTF